MSVFEWIGTIVLGLQATALAWIVRDYLQFRVNVAPDLVTSSQCDASKTRCQNDLAKTLESIQDDLRRGRDRFGSVDVRLAKICTALDIDCD